MKTGFSNILGVTFILFGFALAGCSSAGHTMEGELQRQWQIESVVDDMGFVDVVLDGDMVMITPKPRERNVEAYSGNSGNRAWRERESVGRRMLGGLTAGGLSLSDFDSDMYEYTVLDGQAVALIFDYNLRSDKVRGRDAMNGRLLWEIEGYPWNAGRKAGIVSALASATGTVEGAMIAGVSNELSRGTTVESLVLNVPELSSFLFKHRGGLMMIESQSGEIKWNVEEFEGAGLAHVHMLPDRDLLVISKYVDTFKDFTEKHHIGRINSKSGEVKWLSEYDAGGGILQFPVATTYSVSGDLLIVHTVNKQIFNIANGELIAKQLAYPAPDGEVLVSMADNAVFTVGYPLRDDPPAFGVYMSHVPTYIQRYDLAEGAGSWKTDETRTTVHSIYARNDMVLASVSGDMAGGGAALVALDAHTGSELWKSENFSITGAFEGFSFRSTLSRVPASNIVDGGELLYVAGPRTLYALNASDGSEIFSIDHEKLDIGYIHRILDHEGGIVVISERGAAVYSKENGELLFRTDRDRVTRYHLAGRNLFLYQNNKLTVYEVVDGEKIARLTTRKPKGIRFGNLREGMYVTPDGSSVYVYDRDDKITKYTIR